MKLTGLRAGPLPRPLAWKLGKVMEINRMDARIVVLTVALTLVPSLAASAKTLYVDPAGNDSVTYAANSSATPWRTVGRAAWGSISRSSSNPAEAARAGDTVIVRAGTYSTAGTGNRWGVAYYTANSGAAGAPIVFQAQGTVTLTQTAPGGPVIGASGYDGPARNYITWKGFTINEANAPSASDTGPVVLAGTIGSSIEDCILDGNGDPGFGDNHPGIRIEGSSDIVVRNNRISNFRTSVVNESNGAGIQVYWSGNVTIEHNEISGSGSGIFLKAPGDGGALRSGVGYFNIRYNHILDAMADGIAVHRAPNTAAMPIAIHQNIVRNARICIRIWTFDQGSSDPRHAKVVNNTLDRCQMGVFVQSNLVDNAGHIVWNNIITNSSTYAINFAGAVSNLHPTRIDFEHNVYFGYPVFAITYSTVHSLSSWQSAFAQDTSAPASINANPMYVNAGALDFRLQPGSVARTMGRDILNLSGLGTNATIPAGAYITGNEVIGRTSGTPGTLAAPTNLRIT